MKRLFLFIFVLIFIASPALADRTKLRSDQITDNFNADTIYANIIDADTFGVEDGKVKALIKNKKNIVLNENQKIVTRRGNISPGKLTLNNSGNLKKAKTSPSPKKAFEGLKKLFKKWEGSLDAGLDRLDNLLNTYPTADRGILLSFFIGSFDFGAQIKPGGEIQ